MPFGTTTALTVSEYRSGFLAHSESFQPSMLPPLPAARGQDAETRRQHESLLRAADDKVHAPVVHAEVDTGDQAHAVDIQERRMPSGVHDLTNRSDVARHAGRQHAFLILP